MLAERIARALRPASLVALACTFALVGSRSSAAPGSRQEPVPPEIERWIRQLGSPNFKERQAATRVLRVLGDEAADALEQAVSTSDDDEIRERAARLLGLLEAAWQLCCRRAHEQGLSRAFLLPDGARLLTASEDETMRLWEVESGRELRRFRIPKSCFPEVAVSPDGRSVMCGADNHALQLRDLTTGELARTFQAPFTKESTGLTFFPKGGRAISVTDWLDKVTIHVWDTKTGKELKRFRDCPPYVMGVKVSEDNRRALLRGLNGALTLWDVERGKQIRVFEHEGAVNDMVVSPDGKRALSGSGTAHPTDVGPPPPPTDCTVRLWDLETGKELLRCSGHTDVVSSVVFSADGTYALSGGCDGTARLWDLRTGKQRRLFKGHKGEVVLVAFLPDGKRALTAGVDGTVRLWKLPK